MEVWPAQSRHQTQAVPVQMPPSCPRLCQQESLGILEVNSSIKIIEASQLFFMMTGTR